MRRGPLLVCVTLAGLGCGGSTFGVAPDGGREAGGGDAPSDAPLAEGSTFDGPPVDSGKGGCDADTSSDPKNCGGCGHDCLGTLCTDSLCGVTALSSGLVNPYALALTANEAFVAVDGVCNDAGACPDGSVLEVPLDGGAVNTVASNQGTPRGIATDGTNVYWADYDPNSGVVVSSPVSGASAPAVVAMGQAGPTSVAAVNGAVFWTDFEGGVIGVQPPSGPPSYFGTGHVTHPSALWVDPSASHVYWTNLDDGSASPPPGSGSVGSATGTVATGYVAAPMPVVPGIQRPTDLTVLMDGTIAWADPDDNEIWILPPGGMPTAVFTGQPQVSRIAAGSSHLYWSNAGDGTVRRGDPSTMTQTKLAQGIQQPGALAVEGPFVYWLDLGATNQPNGGLFRVAR